MWPHDVQHARLPYPLLSPRVCSNSCPLSCWCHPTLSSSVAPFSSCPRLSYLLYLGMKPTKKTHVPYHKNGATPSPDIWAWCLLVLVTQSCPTLCDPMDCSPPGSSVHGILQARILEGVAIPFSRGSSPPRNWTQVSWIAVGFFTIWAARGAHVF